MAQSIVSEAAQIREMSPEELEQEWYNTSKIHQQHIRTQDYGYRDITMYSERFTIIAKNYYQLTGKTLN